MQFDYKRLNFKFQYVCSENKIVNGVFLIKIKETSFNKKKKDE